jgi:hypothetical protein
MLCTRHDARGTDAADAIDTHAPQTAARPEQIFPLRVHLSGSRHRKSALHHCARRRALACRAFAYCGPAHQRADWARHKADCHRRKAAKQAAAASSDGEPQQLL